MAKKKEAPQSEVFQLVEKAPLRLATLSSRLNQILSRDIFSEEKLASLYEEWQSGMPKASDYGMNDPEYQVHCEQLFSGTLLIYHLLRKYRGIATRLTQQATESDYNQTQNLSHGLHREMLNALGSLSTEYQFGQFTTLEEVKHQLQKYTELIQTHKDFLAGRIGTPEEEVLVCLNQFGIFL